MHSHQRCCICKSKRPITLHKFPKNKRMYELWKGVCNYDERDDASRLAVCMKHFRPEDYFNWIGTKFIRKLKLKPNAVMSISVPNPLPLQDPLELQENEIYVFEEDDTMCLGTEVEIVSCGAEIAFGSHKRQIWDELPVTTRKRKLHEPRYVAEIELWDLMTPVIADRTLDLVKRTVGKKNHQIQTLEQHNGRLRKQVSALKEQLKQLRKGKAVLNEDTESDIEVSKNNKKRKRMTKNRKVNLSRIDQSKTVKRRKRKISENAEDLITENPLEIIETVITQGVEDNCIYIEEYSPEKVQNIKCETADDHNYLGIDNVLPQNSAIADSVGDHDYIYRVKVLPGLDETLRADPFIDHAYFQNYSAKIK